MSKGGASNPGFGSFIEAAIMAAGFRTPTEFARTAGMQPSVVLRWIRGETDPTGPLLRRAAPHLGVEEAALFAAAFPSDTQQPPPPPTPAAIANLVDEYHLADPADRELLLEQVRRVAEWARYRREVRKE